MVPGNPQYTLMHQYSRAPDAVYEPAVLLVMRKLLALYREALPGQVQALADQTLSLAGAAVVAGDIEARNQLRELSPHWEIFEDSEEAQGEGIYELTIAFIDFCEEFGGIPDVKPRTLTGSLFQPIECHADYLQHIGRESDQDAVDQMALYRSCSEILSLVPAEGIQEREIDLDELYERAFSMPD